MPDHGERTEKQMISMNFKVQVPREAQEWLKHRTGDGRVYRLRAMIDDAIAETLASLEGEYAASMVTGGTKEE